MRRILWLAVVLAASVVSVVLLGACSVVNGLLAPTSDARVLQTRVARGVAGTLTTVATAATATPLPSTTPAPTGTRPPVATVITSAAKAAATVVATSSRAPTTPGVTLTATVAQVPPAIPPKAPDFPDATYTLKEERVFGYYAVRYWHNAAEDSSVWDGIVTIAAVGQPAVQINYAVRLGELTGEDILGEGAPVVVVETYSGGAHCCSATFVYALGARLTRVLQTPESNCGGQFRDLDRDGVYEFITCDDAFAYQFCSYADSPTVKVILRYQRGQGYVPASPRYASEYVADIAQHTVLARDGQPGERGELDNTTKCSVLPVVLDYLYSGQTNAAWAELELRYPYDDVTTFRTQIEETLKKSVWYVAK